MHWPWSPRREVRSSYEQTIIDALLSQAEGKAAASPMAVAAVESCGGFYGRAFAQAIVDPSDVIPAAVLYDVGRDLALHGQYLSLLELTAAGPLFVRPESHTIRGGYRPESWAYDLWLAGPTTTTRMGAGRARVVHVLINASSSTPWSGQSPISAAGQTGRLMAELESALSDESSVPVGRLLSMPEGNTNLGTLQQKLNSLRGKLSLVETVAGGFGDRGAAPSMDWKPQRVGPDFTAASVSLRELIEQGVAGLYGIHPSLLGANSDGTMARESWRRFQRAALEPLAVLAAAEFSRVLGVNVSFDFARLRASDTAGQARAFRALVGREATIDTERALILSGMGGGAEEGP